jgi:hypothetical protein
MEQKGAGGREERQIMIINVEKAKENNVSGLNINI